MFQQRRILTAQRRGFGDLSIWDPFTVPWSIATWPARVTTGFIVDAANNSGSAEGAAGSTVFPGVDSNFVLLIGAAIAAVVVVVAIGKKK